MTQVAKTHRTLIATEAASTSSALIEGFRGLAAALVLYTHYWGFSEGAWALMQFAHTGVDLFFVLSGYVFGAYFAGKPLHWGGFWLRRFFRIYPLYLLALGLYALQKSMQGQPLLYLFEHLSFTYLQTKAMAFYYNPPFWSLPAEVAFYGVLPPLTWLMLRLQKGRWGRSDGLACRPWLVAFGLVLFTAIIARAYLGYAANYNTENSAYLYLHHLPGVAVEFLLGASVWVFTQGKTLAWLKGRKIAAFVLSGAVIAWLTLAAHFAELGDAGIRLSLLKGQIGGLAACCYALMLWGCLLWLKASPHQPSEQDESCRNYKLRKGLRHLAQFSGKLSYGIYLFHMAALWAVTQWLSSQALLNHPLLGPWLSAPWLALALTLTLAWICHLAWEEPWRRLGRRLAARLEKQS